MVGAIPISVFDLCHHHPYASGDDARNSRSASTLTLLFAIRPLSISSMMREFEIALQIIGEVTFARRASYDTARVQAIIGLSHIPTGNSRDSKTAVIHLGFGNRTKH